MEIDGTESFDFLPESSSGLHLQIHPLVLLNVGDHFTRVVVQSEEVVAGFASASSDGTNDRVYQYNKSGVVRVIGCLLGEQKGRILDVRNSFDLVVLEGSDESVDFDMLHKKLEQYRQVHPGMDFLGWYATGSDLQDVDVEIHSKMLEINGTSIFMLYNPVRPEGMNDDSLWLFESERHTQGGNKSTVFTRSKFEFVSSEMENVVANHLSNVSLSDDDTTVVDQLKNHHTNLKGAVESLIERVKQMHSILLGMKQGNIGFDPVVVRLIAEFADKLPAADQVALFSREQEQAQKDSTLNTLLAVIVAGSASSEKLMQKHTFFSKRGKEHLKYSY
eukprot:jgi/Picsp_1/2228/NSC_05692-R1_cop9 signalosome complex subunit 6a